MALMVGGSELPPHDLYNKIVFTTSRSYGDQTYIFYTLPGHCRRTKGDDELDCILSKFAYLLSNAMLAISM